MSESVDKMKIQKQVNELKEINEYTENFLKKLGINLKNLPENINGMIDDLIKLYSSIGMNEIDLTLLQEWYSAKMHQCIDLESNVLYKLKSDCQDLEAEIEKEEHLIQELEVIVSKQSRCEKYQKEIQQKLKDMDCDKKELAKKKENLKKSPPDVDLNELIALLEKIEKTRKNK